MMGRNAKQKEQFLAVDEYTFIHYDCILASPAWSTVVLVNGQPQLLHPVLDCIVAWNLSALTFKYLAEDLQNLHHGAKTAVRTGVNQYAELDYQKRISMSGNSVESNFFCSLLKVAVVTSFFLSSALVCLRSSLAFLSLPLVCSCCLPDFLSSDFKDLFSSRRRFSSSSGVSLRDVDSDFFIIFR